MVIVSDASPIIALALCDKLDVLDKLFAQVKPSLDVLANNGFRISDMLYRQILGRAGE
jgi:predicted nucleic acid-binding protein